VNAATRLAASLEERGFVVRQVDETDRRSSQVTVSTDGRQKLDWARRVRTEHLARRIAELDEEQQRQLLALLPLLEQL
jgi:DNA-binding MarR family transcriptional regulator